MINFAQLATDVLNSVSDLLFDPDFRQRYTKENSFQRNRKMPFEKLFSFLIERSSKSYDAKLATLFERINYLLPDCVSKQAISKARQNISAEAFYEIFKLSSTRFLQTSSLKKHWKGFQVYAVDATDLQIPTTDETLHVFGNAKNRFGVKTAKASASAIVDVLNDVILDSVIKPYRTSERSMAKEIIQNLPIDQKNRKTVIVFDRGYPSYGLFRFLDEQNVSFLMRLSSTHTRLINKECNDYITLKMCDGIKLPLRLLHIPLPDGTLEYLVTNITAENYSLTDFYELYFMRWGIESKYKELKDRYQIEEFSGSKCISIMQDFYITLFLSNLSSFIKNDADAYIEKEQSSKTNSKKYQSNRSIIIEYLNRCIIKILLNPSHIVNTIEEILIIAKRKRSQIRPNRTYERKLSPNRRKHHMNKKACF